MSSRIAIWSAVPDGSTLSISAKGTTRKTLVTAHAFLMRNDGMEQTFPDDLLQPGPLDIELESPNTYSILTDLVYTTSGTADVTAVVVSPKGKKIPPDGETDPKYKITLAGSQGQTLGLTFMLITV